MEAAGRSPVPGVSREAGSRAGALPPSIQVVEFMLGSERFAIDLFDVREVVEYTPVTKIPRVPPYVIGIIDLRGDVIRIIDLKDRLSIPRGNSPGTETSRIIVLDSRITAERIGILVDDVMSVSTFDSSQVDRTSSSFNRDETAIIGIIKRTVRVRDKDSNELIIWIDIRKLVGRSDNGSG